MSRVSFGVYNRPRRTPNVIPERRRQVPTLNIYHTTVYDVRNLVDDSYSRMVVSATTLIVYILKIRVVYRRFILINRDLMSCFLRGHLTH